MLNLLTYTPLLKVIFFKASWLPKIRVGSWTIYYSTLTWNTFCWLGRKVDFIGLPKIYLLFFSLCLNAPSATFRWPAQHNCKNTLLQEQHLIVYDLEVQLSLYQNILLIRYKTTLSFHCVSPTLPACYNYTTHVSHQ